MIILCVPAIRFDSIFVFSYCNRFRFYDFIYHSRHCFCNRPITKSWEFLFLFIFFNPFFNDIHALGIYSTTIIILYDDYPRHSSTYMRMYDDHDDDMIKKKKSVEYNCLIIMLNYTIYNMLKAAIGRGVRMEPECTYYTHIYFVYTHTIHYNISARPSVGGPFSCSWLIWMYPLPPPKTIHNTFWIIL